MGSVEELAKAAFGGTQYTATFRFHFEPARRLVVNEMGMSVENFRAFADGAEVHPRATDDQNILLSLMRIRAHKRLAMWLWGSKESSSGAMKLNNLWRLKSKFFISLGVQKRVDGQLAGLYILRDPVAKIFILSTVGTDERSVEGHPMWDVVLDLSKPEILHGAGPNLDAKHFKRI